MLTQVIDNACQFVSRGRDGRLGPLARPQAAVIPAQGGLGVPQGLGRQAQGLRGARLRTLRGWLRSTLPPEMSLCGASPPRHEAKCFSLGHWLISVPISARMVRAVLSSSPVMAVRSMPRMQYKQARASKAGEE